MGINISAIGYGLAAVLGLGAVVLAALERSSWPYFLIAAVLVSVISTLLRKIKI